MLQKEKNIITNKAGYFADVVLPIPIPKLYTYSIPHDLDVYVHTGSRVLVQFGAKKVLTGIVAKLHYMPPEHYKAKDILDVLDHEPIITPVQIKLWEWVAHYYMCSIGEVFNASVPSGLKLSSQSHIQKNPSFSIEGSDYEFSENESHLLDALEKQDSLSFSDAENLLSKRNFAKTLKSLIQKEAILLFEQIKDKYKPKTIKKIRLASRYIEEKSLLEGLFDKLEKKPKQTDVILKYLQKVPVYHHSHLNIQGLEKSEFNKLVDSGAALQTLIKAGILEEFSLIISRFEKIVEPEDSQNHELSDDQKIAKDKTLQYLEEKNTVLLHGITGSGKTAIYIDLIKSALESGTQVLYLLPEIALTTQIVNRLRKVFGNQMGIYHSKFSDNERVETWKGLISGKFQLIVGVRSSVLLPFSNLGLIIVDEEHESSFKQLEPAPRYNARDLALVLASLHGSKAILGSATPSVESYYNALKGKYGLVSLNKRYGEGKLPDFEVADLNSERKRKLLLGNFSSVLFNEISQRLQKKEQVILFQNRRGYAPYLSCESCEWIPKCNHCAVSLTYHMYSHELRCHYCGAREKVPPSCLACGSNEIKTKGYGTEKIEEELKLLIPEARIQRMDLDTTRRKLSFQKIIEDFEAGNIDILVGTQMISKGFDFDNVSLVGIFDIDRIMHFPDFRSFERTFQLITQVSGRAGRKNAKGKVVIQTGNPHQPLLQKILQGDYKGFYEEEIAERDKYHYPPFVRLIKILIKDKDQEVCQETAQELCKNLKVKIGAKRVLGPQEPIVSKIRGLYIFELMIKLEKNIQLDQVKEIIKSECNYIRQTKTFKSSQIIIDVDPF